MDKRQQLTSPHILRSSSALSSHHSMEIVTEPWFEGKEGSSDQAGWGPPIIARKDNAWEEGLPGEQVSSIEARRAKRSNTTDWLNEQPPPGPDKVVDTHPMSAETQAFLASMVGEMREELETNTGVMALLEHAPVSVFEDRDYTAPVDFDYHADLNAELEDFLKQIKHIRDGPSPLVAATPTGEVAQQLTAHLDQHKGAVEQALAQLDRELTTDSELNGSEGEHEEEFKRLVMERQATEVTVAQSSARSTPRTTPRTTGSTTPRTTGSTTGSGGSTPTPDTARDSASVCTEPPLEQEKSLIKPQKKLDLYGWLELHPDPKVRKAAIQMKRLDDRLKSVIQKEREVKKQRAALNKHLLLFTEGSKLLQTKAEEEEGDDLTLITELQEGLMSPIFMTMQEEEEEGSCVTPTECSLPSIHTKHSMTSAGSVAGSSRKSKTQGRAAAPSNTRRTKSSVSAKSGTTGPTSADKKRVNNKNFIARNKELAQDASAAVAMTDEEKERLNELLEGIDEEEVIRDEDTVCVLREDGFSLSKAERGRMEEIEAKLITEEQGALSICSGQSTLSIQSSIISQLDKQCPVENIKLGEDQLKRQVLSRNEQDRIGLIDQMLLQCAAEEQPELPPGVLESLLTQCRSEMGLLDEGGSDLGAYDMLSSEQGSFCVSPVL